MSHIVHRMCCDKALSHHRPVLREAHSASWRSPRHRRRGSVEMAPVECPANHATSIPRNRERRSCLKSTATVANPVVSVCVQLTNSEVFEQSAAMRWVAGTGSHAYLKLQLRKHGCPALTRNLAKAVIPSCASLAMGCCGWEHLCRAPMPLQARHRLSPRRHQSREGRGGRLLFGPLQGQAKGDCR